MEHFVSNFKPAEVGEHLETLMDVFCNKLRTYFLQIGILSQKKNTALFNFEESNIRCFYHRLKEYYKSMGWDSVEGLSKIAGANSNRKMKLVRLAQNMVEKGTAIKTTTKGSASYYPVGSELKKSLNTRQQTGIPVSKQGLIRNIYDDMIMEEMVEEDDKMLEEAYTSSKKKKKEKETQAKSKKRLEAPVINVKPTQPATTQISKLEGKKAAPSTHQTNKLSKPSSLSMPMNDSPDIRTNNMETKPAEKQQYSGLFSKALVPKPSVTKIDKNASSSVKISPSDQAAVKKPLAAKTSTSYAAKSGAVERKAVQPMKEATTVNRRKNIVISKEKEKPIFEKFGKIVDIAESSEDGPPRKSISSEELFEDLECRVPLSPFANKEIMPIMEFADESMRLESEADIKECQISDSLNNKNEYKELANFDEEVSGELFDPIEKERHKPSPSSPSRVPVISENVASAVLAPIHETQSFSSEEGDSGGDIPRSDSDFRASFKSNQLSQMNSSNIPQHQAQTNSYQLQYSSTSSSYHMPVPISSSNYQMPVPLAGTYDFYSNFNQSDQAKTARKSSFSQMSQNTDVQNESPRQQGLGQNNTMNHMSYMAGSVALSNSSLTHSRNESYVQPELAKKNSKNRRASNVTSSVVSRDSSTKPPTRMSSSSVRAKHSGSILGRERLPSSGNLNSAPANVVSVTTYEEFSSRCKGECSIFAVLYCSILLLNRRDKEASKEISYQFNLGMLNDDLYLVGQMAKLKAVILIFEKKLEQALKFLNLYKDISRIYNDDIGQATSLFGIGYCRFIQGDLIKAKIGFTESSKRYGCLKHVFGEYYSIRNLYKILIKEKKEKEAKEYQERMRNINSAKNIKSCINGIDYKKGTFIMRTRGELLSILIEMASWSDYKEAKDREKFRVKMILKQAAELSEEYCK